VSDIIHDLNSEVQRGEIEKVKELVKRAVDQGVAPMDVLENGLRPAMEEVGRKFECLEIFLPEMMKAAELKEMSMTSARTSWESCWREPVSRSWTLGMTYRS
jgi:methanogenic corrinoid protein MtbC1